MGVYCYCSTSTRFYTLSTFLLGLFHHGFRLLTLLTQMYQKECIYSFEVVVSSQCIIICLIYLFKIQYGDTLRTALYGSKPSEVLWQSFQQFSVQSLCSLHACKYGNVGKCVICFRSTAVLAALLSQADVTSHYRHHCEYTMLLHSHNYGPLCLAFPAVKRLSLTAL